MQGNSILLVDGSADRRRLLRAALERRGYVVAGEAGSVVEIVEAAASLEDPPTTVMVGASVEGTSSDGVARLLKRAWPRATVIQESAPATPRWRRALRQQPVAAGA